MSYKIKDKIYENRWLFGGRIRFEHQEAIVPDKDIRYFKSLPNDFEIGVYIEDIVQATEVIPEALGKETPIAKQKKRGRK